MVPRKAVTVKEISGRCIDTIPVGTEFVVIHEVPDYFYVNCEGLGVSSVWSDEFKYLNEADENEHKGTE